MEKLICEKRSYGAQAIHHAHAYHQLILPLTGRLNLELEKQEIKLSNDRFCFLPSDYIHGFSAKGDNQFVVMDIPERLSCKNNGLLRSYKIDQAMDTRWDAIRSLLVAEIDQGKTGDLHALLNYIWSMMDREIELESVSFMKKNISKPITMKDLALLENYHPAYFAEWFYGKMGKTPQAFFRKLKVERAKELMEKTNDNLLQIALAVGYGQQSSLTRLFIREEGMSPSEYRKQIRNSAK